MVEVIEHIELDQHEKVFKTIFQGLQPEIFIMTTPNIEFNKFFKPIPPKKEAKYLGEALVIDKTLLNPELAIPSTHHFNKHQHENGLRHHDHEFEFNIEDFTKLCESLTKKYPNYSCEDTGIKYSNKNRIIDEYWEESQTSYVTQVAIFRKN